MNTGIVTFFPNNNYGCLLQAFALQIKVNAEIISFEPSYWYLSNIRNKFDFLHIAAGLFRFFFRHFSLKSLKENKIISSSIFHNISELEQVTFDVLIAGSDQIWHSQCLAQQRGGFRFYFLNFGKRTIKRISYAASISQKQWPKDFEQKVLPMLRRFDAISVREESAVSYLTSLGLKNVVCVCDPTILHKGDFYRKEFPYNRIEEEFSFVYRIREVVPDSVQSILLPQNKEIWLSKQWRWRLPSVTQWLQNIDNAKFVVTDSFHCAVFCILFHKPFLVIPNRSTGKGMNERFATLLGKTGLEYRCLTCEESSEVALQKLNTPVDWEKVDAILEEWRTYSADWLEMALGE